MLRDKPARRTIEKMLAFLCFYSTNEDRHLEVINILESEILDETALFNSAVEHGITGLVCFNEKIIGSEKLQAFYQRIETFNKHHSIATNFIDSEAIRMLQVLIDKNISYVVLKGFALARTVYPNSASRTKSDIDILVSENEYEQVKAAFISQQYSNPRGWEPKSISNEFSMSKQISKGIDALFDVHVKISNNKVIEDVLNFDELYSSATSTTLSDIKLINKPYALIHAVIHLLNHRSAGDMVKLIWLFDIYLLVEQFTLDEKQQAQRLIIEKGLARVSLECFKLTTDLFSSRKLVDLIEWCQQGENQSKAKDRYDALLSSTKGMAGVWVTLRHTPGLWCKWQVIQEIAFPPKAEIHHKYGMNTKQPLFWLYIRRIVGGVIKFLDTNNSR